MAGKPRRRHHPRRIASRRTRQRSGGHAERRPTPGRDAGGRALPRTAQRRERHRRSGGGGGETMTAITGPVHLIGIGGIHMSAIALLLLEKGVAVTGSDLRRSEMTEKVERAGARVFEGHAATN